MERATRLELAIFSLGRRHSTTELCPHRTSLIYHKIPFFSLIFYKFPLLQVNSSTIFLNIYVKILQNFFSFSFSFSNLCRKLLQERQFKCLLYFIPAFGGEKNEPISDLWLKNFKNSWKYEKDFQFIYVLNEKDK